VDEVRAIAKTSQALREGAPQIRAAHKDELEERAERTRRVKRKKAHVTAPPAVVSTAPAIVCAEVSKLIGSSTSILPLSTSFTYQSYPQAKVTLPNRPPTSSAGHTLSFMSTDKALETLQKNVQEAKHLADQQRPVTIPPLVSNKVFEQRYSRPEKRARVEENNLKNFQFDPSAETPPLTSAPQPHIGEIPPLHLGIQGIQRTYKTSGGSSSRSGGLLRSHSLALSDLSARDFTDADEEFVNPFADESDIVNRNDLPRPHPSRLLRNISSDEARDNRPDSNHFHVGRNRSSLGNMSSRYVSNSARPMPHHVISATKNCFCDCGLPLAEGESCICGDLADHLLHRGDGVAFFLKET
jgi:hypothetical protein